MKNITMTAAFVLVASLSACGTSSSSTDTVAATDNARVSSPAAQPADAKGQEGSTPSTAASQQATKAVATEAKAPKEGQSHTKPVGKTNETAPKEPKASADKTAKPPFAQVKKTSVSSPKQKVTKPQTQSAKTGMNYTTLTTNGAFLTSDKSVMCVVYRSGKVMCAAKEINYDLPQAPKRCAGQDYGHSITASPAATARFNCGSDYVYSSAGKVLPAGKTLVGPRGLTCSATASSVACDYNGKSSFIYSDDNFTAN